MENKAAEKFQDETGRPGLQGLASERIKKGKTQRTI
jgi:hypothetical protein